MSGAPATASGQPTVAREDQQQHESPKGQRHPAFHQGGREVTAEELAEAMAAYQDSRGLAEALARAASHSAHPEASRLYHLLGQSPSDRRPLERRSLRAGHRLPGEPGAQVSRSQRHGGELIDAERLDTVLAA